MTTVLARPAADKTTPACQPAPAPSVDALVQVLRQLADVIRAMTDAQYTTSPVGVFASSIGGHVRHCLDHVASLLAAVETGVLNYDHRERGTAIESDRAAALQLMAHQERELLAIHPGTLARPMNLSAQVTAAGTTVDVSTSLARELVFAQSHTIHHNALIAAMAAMLGVPLPARFGYAPATLAYLGQTSCAPSPSSR